jgi:hypothetical protein
MFSQLDGETSVPDPHIVADLGFLSQILIFIHSGSRIQQQQQKKSGGGGIIFTIFFCSHKYQIIKNYLIFEPLKKKICANLRRIMVLFTPKNATKLSKIWDWDLGPGIRDPEKS